MPAQPLHKRAHIGLRRRQQHAVPLLQMLGKLLQVAPVRLATCRPQPFFHAQIRNKLPHRLHVARNLSPCRHRLIIASKPDGKLPGIRLAITTLATSQPQTDPLSPADKLKAVCLRISATNFSAPSKTFAAREPLAKRTSPT